LIEGLRPDGAFYTDVCEIEKGEEVVLSFNSYYSSQLFTTKKRNITLILRKILSFDSSQI